MMLTNMEVQQLGNTDLSDELALNAFLELLVLLDVNFPNLRSALHRLVVARFVESSGVCCNLHATTLTESV
jgi:hypothetical protein